VLEKEMVELKLQELHRYLSQLKNYQGVTASELEKDLEKAWIVQHGLQLSIQVVLDIGSHILAAEGVTVQEYEDIFLELARIEVVPEDYAHKIKGMAGFRNLLVHEYVKVDMTRVTEILNNRLDDFSSFASYVIEYLTQK